MRTRLLLALFLLGTAPALALDDAGGAYLFDLMKQPAYAKAWKGMVAGESVPPWVESFGKTLNATGSPVTEIPVGGEPYTLAWICKPHDCGDNQLYVLFAPGARQAWGLLISGGDRRSWLGRPDPAIQAAILSGVQ
jgi:hypothetical protein